MKYTITIDIPDDELEFATEYFSNKYGYKAEWTEQEIKEETTTDEDGNEVVSTSVINKAVANPVSLLEHVSNRISDEISEEIHRKKREKVTREAMKTFEAGNSKKAIGFNISE